MDNGRKLLDREKIIRGRWDDMQRANLSDDNSVAGGDIINAVNRWKLASGVGLPSFAPQWQEHEDLGYDENECRATVTGDQVAIGRFLYELETDPIPVNLEECEIATRDAKTQQLTLTARFSFARLTADAGNATTAGGRRDEPAHAILAGLAALGLVVALAVTFGGGGPDLVKPLRTASASSSPAPSGSPGAAPRSGYDAFRLFHTRNVFDPDRRPPRAVGGATPPPATPPPTRADFVALTGTMLHARPCAGVFLRLARRVQQGAFRARPHRRGGDHADHPGQHRDRPRRPENAGGRRPDRALRRQRRPGDRARAGDLRQRAVHGVGRRGGSLARREWQRFGFHQPLFFE